MELPDDKRLPVLMKNGDYRSVALVLSLQVLAELVSCQLSNPDDLPFEVVLEEAHLLELCKPLRSPFEGASKVLRKVAKRKRVEPGQVAVGARHQVGGQRLKEVISTKLSTKIAMPPGATDLPVFAESAQGETSEAGGNFDSDERWEGGDST